MKPFYPLTVEQIRYHSDGRVLPFGTQVISDAKTFIRKVIHCELLFGAGVSLVDDKQFTLVTRVMGCEDHTTFIDNQRTTHAYALMRELINICIQHQSGNHGLVMTRADMAPAAVAWLRDQAGRTRGALYLLLTSLGICVTQETHVGDMAASMELYMEGSTVDEINYLLSATPPTISEVFSG